MEKEIDNVIDRYAARVVLIDRYDRVLLFRCQEPGEARAFWITPGGGLEPGESHEQAARRELLEETGLAATSLGPCVWKRSHVFPWLGKTYRQHERFYLHRINEHRVQTTRHTADEQRVLTEYRWWSVQELRGNTDLAFAPRQIAERLDQLLIGELPTEPIDVGA